MTKNLISLVSFCGILMFFAGAFSGEDMILFYMKAGWTLLIAGCILQIFFFGVKAN